MHRMQENLNKTLAIVKLHRTKAHFKVPNGGNNGRLRCLNINCYYLSIEIWGGKGSVTHGSGATIFLSHCLATGI